MTYIGIIPNKRLGKYAIPVCSACLYMKASQKQWRDKTRKNYKKDSQDLKLGDVVSVNQLVLPTPGLEAQMTGKLTTLRYKYATVFVDQVSTLGFVYLQKDSSADEIIKGK